MSQFVNRVTIVGNVTEEPKFKVVRNGGNMITFPVITKKTWVGHDEEKKSLSEYHDVVVFGSFAEVCERSLKNGSHVYIEGEIETVNWENDDGTSGSKKQIRVKRIIFLDN